MGGGFAYIGIDSAVGGADFVIGGSINLILVKCFLINEP